jgi:hypothetical protein
MTASSAALWATASEVRESGRGAVNAESIRVFWQPGCSACVKVKEFLTGLGVSFESVDVLNDAEGGVKAKSADRLPPVELVARWLDVLAIERSLVAQIPVDKLGRRPIPNRDRTLRDLAYHTYQIPDVFVRNVEGEFEDWAHYVNLPTPPRSRRAPRSSPSAIRPRPTSQNGGRGSTTANCSGW